MGTYSSPLISHLSSKFLNVTGLCYAKEVSKSRWRYGIMYQAFKYQVRIDWYLLNYTFRILLLLYVVIDQILRNTLIFPSPLFPIPKPFFFSHSHLRISRTIIQYCQKRHVLRSGKMIIFRLENALDIAHSIISDYFLTTAKNIHSDKRGWFLGEDNNYPTRSPICSDFTSTQFQN